MLTNFVNHEYNPIQIDDVTCTGEKATDKFWVWLCTNLTWGVSCGELIAKYDRHTLQVAKEDSCHIYLRHSCERN
jgi:hypothetical protein